MRTTSAAAQSDIPICKIPMLVELQLQNGCHSFSLLQRTGAAAYTHHSSIDDLIDSMTSVVTGNLLDKIRKSRFFALEADESTESANKSVLIVCIRFVADGSYMAETHFLAARELQCTDANSIFRTLFSILEENELNLSNMVGLAADGAAVMQGCRTGVVTQVKEVQPHLISHHCFSHKLQLLSKKSAELVHAINKLIGTVNTFAKTLKFGPKLCRALDNSQELSESMSRKIKQVSFTCWLSFGDSCQALAGCLPAVISALIRLVPKNQTRRAGHSSLNLQLRWPHTSLLI